LPHANPSGENPSNINQIQLQIGAGGSSKDRAIILPFAVRASGNPVYRPENERKGFR
jgi:hypothetical protein